MTDGFKEGYALFLLRNISYLQKNKENLNLAKMYSDCKIAISVIEKLDEQTRVIISDVYFNGCTWLEVMEKRFVSHTTIARCRKKALNAVMHELEANRRIA